MILYLFSPIYYLKQVVITETKKYLKEPRDISEFLKLLDTDSKWLAGKAHPHDTVGGTVKQKICFMDPLLD